MKENKYLYLSIGTLSSANLSICGAHKYAAHSSTEVVCVCYAFGKKEINTWMPGTSYPEEVKEHILSGGMIVSHNTSFDRVLWEEILQRQGWPDTVIYQWMCIKSMSLAMSLPEEIIDTVQAVGLKYTKVLNEIKDKNARIVQSCQKTVELERKLHRILFELCDLEKNIWQLDQLINNRGVPLDVPLIMASNSIVEQVKIKADEEIRRITDGDVAACTNIKMLTEWIRKQGVEIAGVAKDDLISLNIKSLPESVRAAIILRQEAGLSSTSKLKAMLSIVGVDNRARGLFQYHGASTGRWAGRYFQPHNLPKGYMNQEEIKEAISLIMNGNVEGIRSRFGNPLKVISSCIRSMIAAPQGCIFLGGDFSSIEARVLAWLADERKVLDVFNSDGKVYVSIAAHSVPPSVHPVCTTHVHP